MPGSSSADAMIGEDRVDRRGFPPRPVFPAGVNVRDLAVRPRAYRWQRQVRAAQLSGGHEAAPSGQGAAHIRAICKPCAVGLTA